MRLYQIDAFASQAFRGNPAAVCLLDGERDERWMQDVAAEMNLSETAFLLPRDDRFSLRWFTPEAEVALCGHATLASAHLLYEEQGLESARFHTKSGLLTARRDGEWIELDFPALHIDATGEPAEPPAGLLESVGVDEDPVTGSAHCALTPYWAAKLGKDVMTAYQASKRGGVVRVRLEGDRVKLIGQAVTVLRGELV
ncbi:MAG TPA: PhzF family phenazine biosynthesis isomerase [Thermoanaerobaculia bacterium]|nr:PhzF family phenazine biosynthesis isomerase [Thermoanaerobaculia bacterium]